MELLARLLGGIDRVKIMRLFLHNDEVILSPEEVSKKTKAKTDVVKKELTSLAAASFIEKKKSKIYIMVGEGKKATTKSKEVAGYRLNPLFPHTQALKDLLFDFKSLDKKDLAERFKTVGRIKRFILSGIFLDEPKARVDVLIVGEAINRQKAEKVFESLSSELGREVVYSIMDTEEYEYRYKMYDKFLRDIIDVKHEVVIDKIKG